MGFLDMLVINQTITPYGTKGYQSANQVNSLHGSYIVLFSIPSFEKFEHEKNNSRIPRVINDKTSFKTHRWPTELANYD